MTADMAQGHVAWAVVKHHMRKRLVSQDAGTWLEPSRLLRVLVGAHKFFLDIPEMFRVTRGSNFLCSVLDFAVLQEWANYGFDPLAVHLGINDILEKYSRDPAKAIHSISFCRSAVLERQRLLSEARVGSPRENIPTQYSLLIGLPRRGQDIYRGLANHKTMRECCARQIGPNLSIALTVVPDAWQLSRIPAGFEISA